MKAQGLIMWVGGFAGILFIYAAYRGNSPLTLFKNSLSQTPGSSVKPSSDTNAQGVPFTVVAGQAMYVKPNQYAPGAIVQA